MLTGIPKHRSVLSRLLKEIVTHPKLKNRLGFKGGTSLFLLEGLPRFSTDLDFDLIDGEAGGEELKKIDSLVKKILQDHGELRDEKIKRNTILNVISYDDRQRNIKVEINCRDFGSTYEPREWLNLALRVMVREDQFAHKLVCLTNRPELAGRDLFDVAFMFEEGWGINEKIVNQRTGQPVAQYLQDQVLPLVDTVNSEKIMNDVGELIQDNQSSQEWVRDQLLDDLEFSIKNYLQSHPAGR